MNCGFDGTAHSAVFVVSNAVLGILFAFAYMMFVYYLLNQSDSTRAFVQNFLIAGIGGFFVGPFLYLLKLIFFPEVRVIEGQARIEAEGFGPERSAWSSELGVVANLSLLVAVIGRNLIQGRGVGSRPEDFKFVTSHSVVIGKHKFDTTTAVARSFVEGGQYRVYYTSGNPLPVLISGEAL